jgi:hypothetical protein
MSEREMRHLSEHELEGLLIERGLEDDARAGSAEAAHLEKCAECGAAYERMRGSVALFRDAVAEWEGNPRAVVVKKQSSRLGSRWSLRLQVGVAMLLLALAVFDQHRRQEHHELSLAKQKLAEQVASDEALMQRVDQQLDEDEPGAMAPLMALTESAQRNEKSKGEK